jgi:hypothetical protein
MECGAAHPPCFGSRLQSAYREKWLPMVARKPFRCQLRSPREPAGKSGEASQRGGVPAIATLVSLCSTAETRLSAIGVDTPNLSCPRAAQQWVMTGRSRISADLRARSRLKLKFLSGKSRYACLVGVQTSLPTPTVRRIQTKIPCQGGWLKTHKRHIVVAFCVTAAFSRTCASRDRAREENQ